MSNFESEFVTMNDAALSCNCGLSFQTEGELCKHVSRCAVSNIGKQNVNIANDADTVMLSPVVNDPSFQWVTTEVDTSKEEELSDINTVLCDKNLVISKEVGIICQSCQSVINCNSVVSHLKGHSETIDRELVESLTRFKFKTLGELREEFYTKVHLRDVVKGLPILLNGLKCKLCPEDDMYCTSLKRSMQKHISSVHKNALSYRDAVEACPVQSLAANAKRMRCFPVRYDTVLKSVNQEETVLFVDREGKKFLEDACSLEHCNNNDAFSDARTRNLFFERYRWDLVIADVDDPENLLKEPNATEEPKLFFVFEQIKLYFVKAEQTLSQLDISLRRYFAQTTQEESFEPGFRGLEQDDSIKLYSSQGAKCAMFHCRLVPEIYEEYCERIRDDVEDTEVFENVHELLKRVFLITFPGNVSLDNNNVNKFLACQSLHTIDGSFDAFYLINPRIARLLHCCRLVALMQFDKLKNDNPETVCRSEDYETPGKIIYENVFRFVGVNTRCICEYLVTIQGYVRRTAITQPHEFSLSVIPGTMGEVVRFRPLKLTDKIIGPHKNGFQSFSLQNLRKFYNLLWNDALKLFKRLVFDVDFEAIVPEGRLNECVDDFNRTSTGFSFLDNNNCLKRCRTVIFRKALRSFHLMFPPAELRGTHGSLGFLQSFNENCEFKEELRKLSWDYEGIRQYLTEAAQFVELLALLIHIGSGQPARGEEIRKWKLRNTQLAARDMFIDDGRILLIPSYSKSRNRSSMDRPVPRYLPLSLSLLMLRYYSLVRPFESLLLYIESGDVTKVNTSEYFLFVQNGKTFARNGMTEKFQSYVFKYFGVSMGLAIYRHIAVYFKETFIQGTAYDDENSAFDLQAGHTRKTATLVYGKTNEMPEYGSTNFLTQAFVVSTQWQNLLNIDQRKTREEFSTTQLRGTQLIEYSNSERPIQKTSSPSLNIPSTEDLCSQVIKTLSRQLSSSNFEQARPAPPAPSSVIKQCLHGLRDLYQSRTAHFKNSEQAKACGLALLRTCNLLVVLPTGSGKSLVFLLPAYLEARNNSGLVTVLVEPLLSLRQDMLRRAKAAGLSCCQSLEEVRVYLEAGKLPNIIVFTTDQVVSTSALQLLASLNERHQLARVVIDEAHTIVADSPWRSVMYRMKNLLQMERQLCSELCIVPYTIRCSTMRPNIEYRVQRLVKRDFISVLFSYCEQAQKITEQGWRGLVFFQSKKVLHSCYEAVQKDTSFKYKVDIMFCTKAFGMGVDYAHVRFSIHYGSPGTIFDYAQESGRCGRDGKHATSLLLHYPFSGFECSDDVNNETYLPTQHVVDIQMFNRTPSAMSTLIIEDDNSFFSAYDASSPLKSKSRVPHQDIDIFSPTIEGNPKISEGNTDAATTQTQISCEISSSSQERKRKIGSDDSASMNVPSSDFSSPTKRVQRNINNNTEVLNRVRSFMENYANQCTICLLNGYTNCPAHAYWKCPFIQGRCLSCNSKDHNARSCPNRFRFQGVCQRCGLTNAFHDPTNFGSKCNNWATGRLIEFCRMGWQIPDAQTLIVNEILHGNPDYLKLCEYIGTWETFPGALRVAYLLIDKYLHLAI
ncbi:hypothetical protein SJAG_05173 [Schizosaccharomyces japonicus yFS275]|uniref:DNA 3'-5' helicase n=1 Tax=Schizosaccharomyces japonicus (strain yFS275 / FY16936) TaxID=402676 RepID=B6JUR5_SCHJY|nr:hypothetical protein SJAG_05173 [Schizosaccharomyces japonicus yFS275]EEB05019.2 hypothetical protein SJAG_05173 [Schizosaccharomyces japonicus yFS275]